MATERKNIKRNRTRKGVEERALYSGIQRNYNKRRAIIEPNGQTKLFN